MFFHLLNQIQYDGRTVIDITKRVNIIKPLLDNQDLYFRYRLKIGDTPESIAYDFYEDVQYFWIILLINEIYDPFYNWYMSYEEVVAYSKLKYGDPDYLTGIKYYTTSEGIKYKENAVGRTPITNLDYEVEQNDSRQVIKIVYPEYVRKIALEYEKLI